MIGLFIRSVGFFALGFLAAYIFEKLTKKWAMWDKGIGWQIHHSIFGLILFVLAFLYPSYAVELVSSGLGIIAQHAFSDGFVFIRRW